MTPYRAKGAKTYKMRVVDLDGRSKGGCSTGTDDATAAADVERMVRRFRAQRGNAVYRRALALIVDGTLKLPDVYDADVAGRLEALVFAADAIDLDPLVTEWAKKARPRYVMQVRRFIPKGQPFPATEFRRKRISAFLAELPGVHMRLKSEASRDSTRNRYRAALSIFARWLVEREIIEYNPVRDVRGTKNADPRLLHYERPQARALVSALAQPFQAMEALMCGAGVELGACLRLRRRDVDLDAGTVFAQGGKTKWRTRTVRVTEDWCWAIVREYVRTLPAGPNAPVFSGFTPDQALDAHQGACRALGLPVTTLHDWRHTYAIQAIRDGMLYPTIKHQLGHSPHSTRLESVYGAFKPVESAGDYRKQRGAGE